MMSPTKTVPQQCLKDTDITDNSGWVFNRLFLSKHNINNMIIVIVLENLTLFFVHSALGKDIWVKVTLDKTCDAISETDVLITVSIETNLQKTETVGKKSEQLDK